MLNILIRFINTQTFDRGGTSIRTRLHTNTFAIDWVRSYLGCTTRWCRSRTCSAPFSSAALWTRCGARCRASRPRPRSRPLRHRVHTWRASPMRTRLPPTASPPPAAATILRTRLLTETPPAQRHVLKVYSQCHNACGFISTCMSRKLVDEDR